MKQRVVALFAGCLLLAGCGSKAPDQAKEQPPASASAPTTPESAPAAPAAKPDQAPDQAKEQSPASAPAPAPGNPPAPEAAQAPPPEQAPAPVAAEPVEAPKPPPPKTYTIATGTAISVRTMDAVDTKRTKTENEFETTLVDALTANGHTLAKPGAPVIGTVVNAEQGGRVKGKASLTLALSRVLLSSGRYLTIHTGTVTQQAKSGTKKNAIRTGLMAGGGAVIGAIAGGGKGAAIGAGVGGGAGVATNLATRGPAAEIPAGTVLTFMTSSPASVTVKPPSR
jgi:hypothetical protein